MVQILWRLFVLSVRQQLTYRAAMLAGLATNLFFGLVRAAVLLALYGSQKEVNGLTIQGAITYTAISQGLIAFLSVFGTFDLATSVYSGAIATDLSRPIHLFPLWMARDLGRSVVNLISRGFIFILAFALFYPILLPGKPALWGWLIVSMLLGWAVSFCWRFLVNLSSFWTPDARGIGRFAFTFSQALSGFIIPLRLFPDWLNQAAHYTPFPAMVNTSIEVYLGILTGNELWQALILQAAWLVALLILCELVLRSGVRKLVIQGG